MDDQQALLTQQAGLTQTLAQTGKPKKKPCCKHRTKKEPWAEGALLTEYQKEYWEKRAPHERRVPIYPPTSLGAGNGFNGDTTYGTTFRAPEGAGPAQPIKPPPGEKENLPFSPWTTYKVDYPAKDVPYARVRPVHKLQASAGPFQDATTMRDAFPGWMGARPATPAQGRSVSVPRGVGPFEGLSAYKDDYRRWPGARAAAAQPLPGQRAALPGGTFNDATTHRTVYTPKQAQPPERARHADQTSLPEGWYDGAPSTEYRRTYTEKDGKPAPRAAATVGASGAALPNGPFNGDTTYGTEFRPRTAPEYERAGRPADDPRDTGPFQGYTTYNNDFVKKDVPYQRVRPTHKLNPSAGPFADATEHKTVFQNWGAPAVYRAGPAKAAQVSVGPFDGTTTYKTDYHKMAGGLRANVGRPNSATRGLRQGPFNGITSYSIDYVPKRADPVRAYRPGTCESCDSASDCEDT